MSDKIYSALTEDFIRRMRNWVKAKDGAPIAGGGVSLYELGIGVDRYREAMVPVLFGEAEDTKTALGGLPARYKQVVEQFWLYEGRPMRWHGRHRAVDRETFETWVMKGHEMLKAELARLSDGWRKHHRQARTLGAGA